MKEDKDSGSGGVPDHMHMLAEIPPKIAVSSFMGYLKGKKQSDDLRKLPGDEI